MTADFMAESQPLRKRNQVNTEKLSATRRVLVEIRAANFPEFASD